MLPLLGLAKGLAKDKHVKFLLSALTQPLPWAFESFDNKPWILYWTINSLTILNARPSLDLLSEYLQQLQIVLLSLFSVAVSSHWRSV